MKSTEKKETTSILRTRLKLILWLVIGLLVGILLVHFLF